MTFEAMTPEARVEMFGLSLIAGVLLSGVYLVVENVFKKRSQSTAPEPMSHGRPPNCS